MIRSMTGYSRVQKQEGGFSLSVGIKSTNHRFLDLQVRAPAALESLEPVVRQLVKEYVRRGHIEVSVTLNHAGAGEVQLNRPLLNAYIAAWRQLSAELGLGSSPDLGTLFRLPGMVTVENGNMPEEEFARLKPLIEEKIAEALRELNAMREREGEALGTDVRRRLERLRAMSGEVAAFSGRVSECARQRLENRLHELLGSIEIDPARLAQEAAYLASRSDIAEELTRFESHLDQVQDLLRSGLEIGKKLDFLLQEMNREANTLLSKTTDVPGVGVEIARLGIEMKSEIEKLREQTQNIE